MTPEQKREAVNRHLASADEEALVLDGFDEAIIGIGHQFTHACVVYDAALIIKILMRHMDESDADEYFNFNIAGAWVGQQTPILFEPVSEEWLDD